MLPENPSRLRSRIEPVVLVAVGVFLAAIPFGSGPLTVRIWTIVAIDAVAVIGLDLISGRAGMLHLGFGVYFGTGAYTVAVIGEHAKLPVVVELAAAVVVAAAVAAATALVLSLVSGYLFAVISLALAAIAQSVVENVAALGSTSGISVGATGLLVTGSSTSADDLYVVVVVVLVVLIGTYSRLPNSRIGRAIEALRSSDQLARASGVKPERVRFRIIVIGGALGGLAGGLYAVTEGFVDPSLFGIQNSVNFLVMDVAGGLGTAWGGIPGAAIVSGVPQEVQGLGAYQLIISAVLLGAVALRFRRGVAGMVHEFLARLAGRQRPPEKDVRSGEGLPTVRPVSGEVLGIVDGSVSFGGLRANRDVSFSVQPGRVLALVGPNGAGKSTLLGALAGSVSLTSGDVVLGTRPITQLDAAARAALGITRTFQLVALCDGLNVRQNVMLGAHLCTRGGFLSGVWPPSRRHNNDLARQQANWALEALQATDLGDKLPSELSTGQQRLVEISRCLASSATTVLLDEPAAGLSNDERRRLAAVVRELATAGHAVMVIEHDMAFVMGVADEIIVLDEGAVLTSGPPSEVQADPRVIEAYWGSQHAVPIEAGLTP